MAYDELSAFSHQRSGVYGGRMRAPLEAPAGSKKLNADG